MACVDPVDSFSQTKQLGLSEKFKFMSAVLTYFLSNQHEFQHLIRKIIKKGHKF